MDKINTRFLWLYVLTFTLNNICVAWTTGGNNQTASIFAAKLNWDPDQTRTFNTLINFSSQVGKAAGALYGGRIIPFGRKKAFIKYNILAFLSCMVMQYVSIWTLAVGKLLNGFFVTVVHIAAVKMINETVPVEVLGKYGSVYSVGGACGYLFVMGFGLGLPSGDYKPGLDNELNLLSKAADEAD